jgi:hypothetical protein
MHCPQDYVTNFYSLWQTLLCTNTSALPWNYTSICHLDSTTCQSGGDGSLAGGTWLPATNLAWTFNLNGFLGSADDLNYVRNAVPYGALLNTGASICWPTGLITDPTVYGPNTMMLQPSAADFLAHAISTISSGHYTVRPNFHNCMVSTRRSAAG